MNQRPILIAAFVVVALLAALGVVQIALHGSGSPIERVDGWAQGGVMIAIALAGAGVLLWNRRRELTGVRMSAPRRQAFAKRVLVCAIALAVLVVPVFFVLPNTAGALEYIALMTAPPAIGTIYRGRRASGN